MPLGSGGWSCTTDLLVMGQASCYCSTPPSWEPFGPPSLSDPPVLSLGLEAGVSNDGSVQALDKVAEKRGLATAA